MTLDQIKTATSPRLRERLSLLNELAFSTWSLTIQGGCNYEAGIILAEIAKRKSDECEPGVPTT